METKKEITLGVSASRVSMHLRIVQQFIAGIGVSVNALAEGVENLKKAMKAGEPMSGRNKK